MKKKKIDFEAEFWDSHQKHSCLTLIDAFFQMDFLSAVRERLNDVVNYSTKCEVLMKEDPSVIFHYYLCMRSFIRASYVLQFKAEKWKVKHPPKFPSKLLQGSLSDEEYRKPFLVFEKAFKEFTLQEFEYFNTQIVYFSLGAYSDEPEANIVTLFIHLNKMLDSAQIIRERGLKKIKDKKPTSTE